MAGRPLIVVLPGIGGSVLARHGQSDEDAVWDASKSTIAGMGLFPELLSADVSLEPRGLTHSTKFLGVTVVAGYEKLLAQLREFGEIDERGDPKRPNRRASVVAVPYDFRRSIVDAAERLDAVVCAHLDGASEAERAGRVIVVAHSMGGLVARLWLGLLGRWPWCRGLITLGTPHRGAPKALDWLVNGPLVLSAEGGVTEMLRGWDSVVQLLPRYPVVRVGDEDRYPHELDRPFLGQRARDAYDLHREIEKSWNAMPVIGPEVIPCIGWSHKTPDSCTWHEGRLRISKKPWISAEGWKQEFGDGTVPAYSAMPLELDGKFTRRRAVRQRHVPLAHAEVITTLIRELQYGTTRMAAGPDEVTAEPGHEPPTIGLDVDELHLAGSAIPVAVTLRRVEADVSTQRLIARLHCAGASGRPLVKTTLTWDGDAGGFVGELPGLSPGLYDVTIRAPQVPGAGDLQTGDTVAVVAGG